MFTRSFSWVRGLLPDGTPSRRWLGSLVFGGMLACAGAPNGNTTVTTETTPPETTFARLEARYRTHFDPTARDEALRIADGLLASAPARHCAIAVRAAWLGGEREGKAVTVRRALDLVRDAEVGHDTTCAAQARALLEDLGVRPQALLADRAVARLEALTPWFDEDAARIVLTLSAGTQAETLAALRIRDDRLSAGTVTALTLPGVVTTGANELARNTTGSGLVRALDVVPVANGTEIRLALDKPGERRVHFLLEPPRVVIDLMTARPRTPRSAPRVVLDAGHGGFDPGAIGPNGLREKDVALDIVQRAARLLRADGFDVRTTRDDDRAVPIEHRSAIANAADAALFVSVHCNASESAHGHGIETYVLDASREPSELRTAARENGGSQDAAAALSMLLAKTRAVDHAARSRSLARFLQDDAVRSIRAEYKNTKDGGVHPAAFSVLVGARMPAVLFETSYVSNPEEAARLAIPAYRQTLAGSLARAIGRFTR